MNIRSSAQWAAVVDSPRALMVGVVKGYRLLLKPWLGNACRFEPTCSQYALNALERHGAIVGASLAAGRLLRCHPWCAGGCDEVPAQPPALFTRLGLTGRAHAVARSCGPLSVSGVSMAQPRPGAKSSESSPLSAQEPAP
ncbi:MAG: membrane protein insertion efficiency factor YidD, partial [Rubrivivax sp.]